MEAAAESLFKSLEQVPDPRKARGSDIQAILRLTLLGLVSGQTTIALFGRLKEPLGFIAPHATTISRALA